MSANKTDTAIAISEAERFLAKAREYKRLLDDAEKTGEYLYSSPARSAVRRASMDLTRALAKWRKVPA